MISYTTINRETGAWIRELRQQWMSPIGKIPDEEHCWGPWKRFACAFVGALTFIAALILHRVAVLGIENPDVLKLYLNWLGIVLFIGIPYSIWFSWLVSWRNFGHGPVRLFLSGMLLPAFVYAVLGFVLTRFADL